VRNLRVPNVGRTGSVCDDNTTPHDRAVSRDLSALVLLGCLLLVAAPGRAAVPTEAEWELWPEMCRARFVIAGDGVGTRYELRVPRAEITQWAARMGQAWEPLHHYCYGLLFMQRADAERDRTQRTHLYSNAASEFSFCYRAVESSSFFLGEYASKLAAAYQKLGDEQSARGLADDVILRAPKSSVGYLLKSTVLRESKDLQGAGRALEQGLATVGDHAADLHYALGLTLLDLNDLAGATQAAERAYGLGYPLPGLRNRLQKAGVTLTPTRQSQ
jgi:tetratricopeptide (TPR) repeat protein